MDEITHRFHLAALLTFADGRAFVRGDVLIMHDHTNAEAVESVKNFFKANAPLSDVYAGCLTHNLIRAHGGDGNWTHGERTAFRLLSAILVTADDDCLAAYDDRHCSLRILAPDTSVNVIP